jgi:hypothetical protein
VQIVTAAYYVGQTCVVQLQNVGACSRVQFMVQIVAAVSMVILLQTHHVTAAFFVVQGRCADRQLLQCSFCVRSVAAAAVCSADAGCMISTLHLVQCITCCRSWQLFVRSCR